jgi:ABC-type uncharacterized transport system permease subunit
MILAASPWIHPTLSASAGLLYLLLAGLAGHLSRRSTIVLMLLTWWLHGLTLASGLGAGVPTFGFAPALSVTAWLVFTVYCVESRLFPNLRVSWPLAGLGAMSVGLALAYPGAQYHGLTSPLLPLHWTLGIASYGLLGAAVVHAWMMQQVEASMRKALPDEHALPLLALERLTFRFVLAAFVVLTLTLIAGWWFAEQLYPAGWVWTHKSVFAMLSWLVLGVLLWGRRQWGWRGRLAVRMLYASAGLLMLAYVGTRFVLEVVLHRL